jgi:putative pyrroloquinoline-quinone binding quinoprotein
MRGVRPLLALALSASVLIAACGGDSAAESTAPTIAPRAIPAAAQASTSPLLDWPEFGLDPQRSNVTEDSSGISPAKLGHLRHRSVSLPGTVDSSPIYLHAVALAGRARNVVVVTTTYGKTIALDADSGQALWTFTPPGYGNWAGSPQITTASPLADPGRQYVYAASPNGLIHKLALADGTEARGWPVSVTRDATHEKLAAALNIAGPDIVVTTGGYIGDAPPYQGHVVLIDRAGGQIRAVFNTLCADRRRLIAPNTCASSDSAILSRAGAVVEPNGTRLLVDTGNGPWNGSTDFGDSVLELMLPSLQLLQSFTPSEQAQLNETDTDLGSSAPALLGHGRVLVAGKDGSMRVLRLSRLNGRKRSNKKLLGGEAQRLPLPGGGQLFTAPAVWKTPGHTTVFVADQRATAAYVLRRGKLYRAWIADTPGTSPVMVGGLLYVYEPEAGGIVVYRPGSPHPVAELPGSPGHWNSPIVVDGHIVEPEGDGNEHRQSGSLEIFSAR